MRTIKEITLRELLSTRSISAIHVDGHSCGYALRVCVGDEERLLATTRGEIKLFSLDSVAKFLRELGVVKFEVDTTDFTPGRLRKPRPDRAAALRKTRSNPVQDLLL
jgi:hypothetical protein